MITVVHGLVLLSAAAALAAWIVAVIHARRIRAASPEAGGLGFLATIVWPFASRRLSGAGAEDAQVVGKALVGFFAAAMLFVATSALLTNLTRLASLSAR
jgi:hypothetical protein